MLQFTKPFILLLLIPMAHYTWRLSQNSLADLSRFRAKLALVLRLVIIVMLVFALAGARVIRNASQQCVVFALDVSDSISKTKQADALSYINRAIKDIKTDQKVGLVVFGGESSVELAPGIASRVEKIESIPSTSNTDISQALGLALASFPEQCAKKIVLLSDGNETIGKSIEQAMLAGSNDVSIDTVPLTSELPREVLLDKMLCPSSTKIGEPFDLKVVAVSKRPTVANIRLLRNGTPVGLKTVELPAGKSMLTFRQSIPKPGGYEYQAILESDDDTHPENNIALAHTKVTGKPRVLYIEGRMDQAKYLSNALTSSDIVVETRDRSGIPTSMAQMQNYDMVVLSDVPAWNLSVDQMQMIRTSVKDLGIGFTMIGGEESFGAGGYYDTPIEKALPVEMSVGKTKILPTLSVVIVMDKSGSMSEIEGGKEKIQLANDAAASVVKLLQPIDYVGIIVCHSSPVTVVGLRTADNKGPIYDQISTIRAEGGGIAVFPSMQMAYDMISKSNTRQKHIILLADGNDCDDQDGVLPLAKKMARERITVTSVAIGDGQHVPFLKATAGVGKGYYYLAKRAHDLKAIFTKDVMMVSKSLILEEPFVPKFDTSAPELGGISTSCPPLLGYVVTSAKPAARVMLASHKNDPILASWQYGLGRTVAFTSDCKARWSARWIGWPDYNRFWAQLVRSTMRKSGPKDYQTSVDIDSGVGRITLDAVDEKGDFLNFLKFTGSVIGPDMRARQAVIEQTGPGRYESSFDAREVGTYVVNVVTKDSSGDSSDVSVISIPYPPEYKNMSPDVGLLKRLSAETSGQFSPPADSVFGSSFRRSKNYSDIWPLLTLLAVILLPIDIAVRRVAMSPEMIAEVYGSVRERIMIWRSKRRAVSAPQRAENLNTLLNVKRQALNKSENTAEPVIPPVVKPERLEPLAKADSSQKKAETQVAAPKSDVKKDADSDVATTSRLLQAKRAKKDSGKTQ